MTKNIVTDRIISELMTALDAIETATTSGNPHALAFIRGLASQATKNCNAQRERNSDGYLVVKSEAAEMPELLRDAVNTILELSEWARQLRDEDLDGDPDVRRQLVADRAAAKKVVIALNAAIGGAK